MGDYKLKEILSKCIEYVDVLRDCPKGYFIYRGSHLQIPDERLFNSNLENREPVNMPQNLHDKVNEIFEARFGWKIRNGVFCYGYTSLKGLPRNLGYGPQFLCFPVGPFKFIYSPEHFDLCGYFFQHFLYKQKTVTCDDIKNLIFMDDSLGAAINAGLKKDGISNEISVSVPTYYLINVKNRDILASAIWN